MAGKEKKLAVKNPKIAKTYADRQKFAEKRIEELLEQIGWSDELWGAAEHLKKYLTRFAEHDRSDLDSIHFELERLTELVDLFRLYR